MRRDSVAGDLYVPEGVTVANRGSLLASDIDGIVIDDEQATLVGDWRSDGDLPNYVGQGYLYSWGGGAKATYPVNVEKPGFYEVQINWHPHGNRARQLAVLVTDATGEHRITIDQTGKPDDETHFRSLGVYQFKANDSGKVLIDSDGARGVTHIDAVVLRPSEKKVAPKSPQNGDQTNRSKPDIIWILAEDISNELSCYGEPGVQTPNIDLLADDGVRYQRAYCTGPACSISRSAMMSGVYQTRIDAHDHRRIGSFTFPAITQYLRSAGYFSAKGCGYSGKTDLNFTPAEKLFDGNDWAEADPEKPVFAQITLAATHRMDTRGKKWDEIRDQSKDPVPLDDVRLPPYFPDVPEVRRDWAVYLDQIEYVDTQVGEILARLESEGRYDNAMIIFCGDNGRCHLRGKNWLYEPGLKVPLVIKWPGGKRSGDVVDGMVSMLDVTATVVDVANATPTEKLDGQSLTNDRFTRELIFAARDAGGEVKDHIRSVCNGRWKYIRNYVPELGYTESKYTREHRPMRNIMLKLRERGELTQTQLLVLAGTKPEEELYDLKADPHEINNLADDAQHEDVKGRLVIQLNQWIESCNDTGLKELGTKLVSQ
ncbi:sulfatase atsG [Rhodopirellula maiorica SM1]|uniref:Sulfatase atsG n=1 Tax=Rhodopirellula maiorica SM1 TaxID=1265738 RepID=M5RJR9_9BACT|nr:sulfatase atsG [Rhodopirellula maiorica SM1]